MKKTKSISSELWLYGHHAVIEALKNPNRQKIRLLATKEGLASCPNTTSLPVQIVPKEQLSALLPDKAVHQGLALLVKTLHSLSLEELLAKTQDKALLVFLDQVQDPHNIGAILRSAAAFDASAVILPDANAPEESGVLAKSACGALEIVPLIRVPNLIRAMELTKKHGFWCIGLDGYATQSILQQKLPAKTAFVMGSEGDGMRRLTAENCDYTVKLPMSDQMESLNVSNATAISLYEWYSQHKTSSKL